MPFLAWCLQPVSPAIFQSCGGRFSHCLSDLEKNKNYFPKRLLDFSSQNRHRTLFKYFSIKPLFKYTVL